jgi:hypothetical protein
MARPRKYEPEKLIAMFRLAAALREQMLEAGFTDNGGAIHSAERILNILGLRLCYPGLSHINNLRHHPNAVFSVNARDAFASGGKVLIEHVSPVRALTRRVIEQIKSGVDDNSLTAFIQEHFQLVLLTPEETLHLNKLNRSEMHPERLKLAGIAVIAGGSAVVREA